MALEQFSQIIPAQRNYVYRLIKLFEVERLYNYLCIIFCIQWKKLTHIYNSNI